jgi:hypothetical protein
MCTLKTDFTQAEPFPTTKLFSHDLQQFITRMMSKDENERPNLLDITHFIFMV